MIPLIAIPSIIENVMVVKTYPNLPKRSILWTSASQHRALYDPLYISQILEFAGEEVIALL